METSSQNKLHSRSLWNKESWENKTCQKSAVSTSSCVDSQLCLCRCDQLRSLGQNQKEKRKKPSLSKDELLFLSVMSRQGRGVSCQVEDLGVHTHIPNVSNNRGANNNVLSLVSSKLACEDAVNRGTL